MERRNKRTKALRSQPIVGLNKQSLPDSMAALNNQIDPQSGGSVQQEPHTEKPDAAIESPNKPFTENPVAAESRSALGSAPELTLAYMPRIGQAVLMRGTERLMLSPQEMMGLIAPGQPR